MYKNVIKYKNMINAKENLQQDIVSNITKYLKLKEINLTSNTLIENIKELCVAKLCNVIGITCHYNYKSDFFELFSSLSGEALCDKFDLKMHVAKDELRLIKYEKINLVETAKSYFLNENIDEVILDTFNLADKFKHLIPKLKKFSEN